MAIPEVKLPIDDEASFVRGIAAGLIAGIVASVAIDRFQTVMTALSSSDSHAEPATDKAANAVSKALTGRELDARDKPLGGQLVHYGLGAGLGALYGIVAEYRRDVTIGHGTAFGLGVAALLDNAAVPAAGLADPPWKTDVSTHVYALASHLVFGAVAELTRGHVRAPLGSERSRG